jgi:hypothetical protein
MRHLWMSLFSNPANKHPLFFELRDCNGLTNPDLLTQIRLAIVNQQKLDEEVFKSFARRGAFYFILDGFDELNESSRARIEKQIIEIAEIYEDCPIVVSGRYQDRFSGWQQFNNYETTGFEKRQVIELISKIPFDDVIKQRFLKLVDNQEFFERHESFFSNPLLAIMMLMNFKNNLYVATKITQFYDDAFITLFKSHDVNKLFHREKNLTMIDFKKAFSLFCMISYHDEKFEFTETEILSYIEKVKKAFKTELTSEQIKNDFVESVNIMYKDGQNYVFIHRSFQEYFAAVSVCTYWRSKAGALFLKLKHRTYDIFFKAAFEIDSELVINEFIKPQYDKYFNMDRRD